MQTAAQFPKFFSRLSLQCRDGETPSLFLNHRVGGAAPAPSRLAGKSPGPARCHGDRTGAVT
eukprot:675962-Hanusia_phi.AAC.1